MYQYFSPFQWTLYVSQEINFLAANKTATSSRLKPTGTNVFSLFRRKTLYTSKY
jgi:hypothetical protein